MQSLPHPMFLKSKIMDLQQALFFSESYSVLKLPISIINVIKVDEVGQVWFMVNRPSQDLNEFEKEFRAKLAFYKKGKNYFLDVRGKAYTVTDPEEVNNLDGCDGNTKKLATTTMVLIRMSISDIKYFPSGKHDSTMNLAFPKVYMNPSAFVKSLQDIVKNIIPVFQSH
jgi:general stress protein 26